MIPESPLIQASSMLVPKTMANDIASLPEALRAYATDLRLPDRMRVWDVCELMPAVALTMLERWDELDHPLRRLRDVAGGGGRLAGAVVAAVREEQDAAAGGPAPRHADLLGLGYAGISELLRFRPAGAAG
jgi:hypothetical protein